MTSGAQAAWAKSWADSPMRRSGGGRPAVFRMGRDRKGSTGAGAGHTPSSSPASTSRSARISLASIAPRILNRGWLPAPVRTVWPASRRLNQIGELIGGDLGQAVAFVDQGGEQLDRRLAAGSGPERPEIAGFGPLGQDLKGFGQSARRLARRCGLAGIGRQRQGQRRLQDAEEPPGVFQFGHAIGRNRLAVVDRGRGPTRAAISARSRGREPRRP